MPSFDVILVGGGTNGLACAARLQRAGRKVLVLEAADTAGGAAVAHDFAPGFRTPGLAHLVNMLDPRVSEGMDLARHGLSYVSANLSSTALDAAGDHLVLEGAAGATIKGSLSAADRKSWKALRAQLLAFAGVLAPFRAITPPRIAKGVGNDYLKLAKLGLGVRMLGKADFREFLRMILINVADVAEDELTDDRLKGLLPPRG